jgi:hypothetical protein
MKQREAVYSATINALAESGIKFEKGMNVNEVMTKDIRTKIVSIVEAGFKAGTVTFKDNAGNNEKMSDPSKLRAYVIGLVNNWHRKDKELNGGTQYEPKNPGSRTGLQDEQLKALRAVKTQFAGQPEKLAKIEEAIEYRLATLKAGKATRISCNMSDLPAELVEALGIDQTDPE